MEQSNAGRGVAVRRPGTRAVAMPVLVALAVAAGTVASLTGPAAAGHAGSVAARSGLEMVSVSSAGVQGDNDSQRPSVSADGRYVAFGSLATNLVPGDTNVSSDIFVHDRSTGRTQRISVSAAGVEGDRDSGLLNGMGGPSISADGRFVAFDSEATNLVSGDTNGTSDVFVKDRRTGGIERVSVGTGGVQASGTEPTISADGRFVAFVSFDDRIVPDGNFFSDIFLHDRRTGVTERISQTPDGSDANGMSLFTPLLGANGRFVYFTSFATNLVPGDPDNGGVDAYLFDRRTRTTTAITSTRGSAEPFVLNHGTAGGISPNGRFLTFTTADDGFVVPDTNGFSEDAWLVDRLTGRYRLVGVNDAGQQGDETSVAGPVSNDGRTVAFVSRATNLGGGASFQEQVYVREPLRGRTRLMSVADDGTPGDLASIEPALTPDGRRLAFASRASTLVPETQDFFANDVFVRRT